MVSSGPFETNCSPMNPKSLPIQELNSISERCQSATALPLALISQKRGRVVLCHSDDHTDEVVVLAKYYGPNSQANANLAASANRDIRRLLTEIKRLRRLLTDNGISPDG
jgi:hypothetical protein